MGHELDFDTIDEKLEDDLSVASFKWLSNAAGVSCYTARKVLSDYKKLRENLHPVYEVIGCNPVESTNETVIRLVGESELSNATKHLKSASSYIFSLQRQSPNASSSLVFSQKFSSLSNSIVSSLFSLLWRPTVSSELSTSSVSTEPRPFSVSNKNTNLLPKKVSKGAANPSNFFTSKPAAATKGFSKQSGEKACPSVAKEETVPPSPKKQADSPVSQQKRRRVVFSSDEEDDDVPAVKESRMPVKEIKSTFSVPAKRTEVLATLPQNEVNTSCRTVSPIKKSVKVTPSKSDEPSTKCVSVRSHEPSSQRRRVRRQVTKTFAEADGFMVTEKVWESASDEEGSVVPEEEVETELLSGNKKKNPVFATSEAPSVSSIAPKNPKLPSRATKNVKKVGGKQSALTNFFKRS